MAKVEAVEIRPGNLLEWDKRVWRVLKSYHVHVGGRGGAFMQVEMKDIEQGTKTNQRFRTEDKVERAFVDARDMQYLYQDGDGYVFMDSETYDQITLGKEWVGDLMLYMKEGNKAHVVFYDGKPISLDLPATVELKVTDTEPSVKGATAAAQFKPATLETGLKVTVPPFVGIGEMVAIDTRTGEYLSRAK